MLSPSIERFLAAATVALGSLVGCMDPAAAQVATPEQTRTLALMKAAPTDHVRTFEYVRASVEARDYEAAIGALERLIAYNPGLTRAKYELGVLYHRMGSFAQAVFYFEETLRDPGIDVALRNRAEAFCYDARKQLQTDRVTGTLFAGVRYNSNVAGVPDGSLVRSHGLDVISRGPFTGRGDGSAVAMADITHVHDFKAERAFTWDTTLQGYGAALFNETRLDHGLLEVTTGPRFDISPDPLMQIMLRPYAVGGTTFVDGRSYVSSIGGGATVTLPLTPFLSISPGIEGRSVSVRDIGGLGSLGTINSGSLLTASLAARWSPVERVTLDGRVYLARNGADLSNRDSNQIGAGVSMRYDFAPPIDTIGVDWSLIGFFRYAETHFDDPDVTIDPSVSRRDRQFRVGAQLEMPLTQSFGLSVTGQYTDNQSNIANFRADAWSMMAGPTLRF